MDIELILIRDSSLTEMDAKTVNVPHKIPTTEVFHLPESLIPTVKNIHFTDLCSLWCDQVMSLESTLFYRLQRSS